jgi:hypothetical protein
MSLFPDLIPDTPQDRRSIARPVPREREAPRYSDLVAGASVVGQAFGLRRSGGQWVKSYSGRGSIDFHDSDISMWSAVAGAPWRLLGHGSTESTNYVRRCVRVIRQAVRDAKEAGTLLSVPIRVKEVTKSGDAVAVVETALLRDRAQANALAAVVEAALHHAGLHAEAVRYVLPRMVRPDEWQALRDDHGEQEGLRQAMILSDQRIVKQLKRAKRKPPQA